MKGPRWATGVLAAVVAGMIFATGSVMLSKKLRAATMQPKMLAVPSNPEMMHCEQDWYVVHKKAMAEAVAETALLICGWVK